MPETNVGAPTWLPTVGEVQTHSMIIGIRSLDDIQPAIEASYFISGPLDDGVRIDNWPVLRAIWQTAWQVPYTPQPIAKGTP